MGLWMMHSDYKIKIPFWNIYMHINEFIKTYESIYITVKKVYEYYLKKLEKCPEYEKKFNEYCSTSIYGNIRGKLENNNIIKKDRPFEYWRIGEIFSNDDLIKIALYKGDDFMTYDGHIKSENIMKKIKTHAEILDHLSNLRVINLEMSKRLATLMGGFDENVMASYNTLLEQYTAELKILNNMVQREPIDDWGNAGWIPM